MMIDKLVPAVEMGMAFIHEQLNGNMTLLSVTEYNTDG